MTIALDTVTTVDEASGVWGTPPFLPITISHAGGSGLGGVLIYATNRINVSIPARIAFTYDGVSVPEIPSGSPNDWVVSSILGRTQVFMLSCIPDGTVDVVASIDGTQDDTWSIVIITLASSLGGIALDDVALFTTTTTADPSVSITNSADAFISAALYSDHDGPSDLAPASGCTDVFEDDHGIDMSAVVRRTSIETAGTYSVGWTATSEESAVIGTAIIEASCGDAYWGILATLV